jgi:hypothetical protein
LEEEILSRGIGHESEVSMRLQFESRLNQNYAKLKETEHKLGDTSTKLRMRTERMNSAVEGKQ